MDTGIDIPLIGANEYDEDEDPSFLDVLGGIMMTLLSPLMAAYKFVTGW